MKFVPSYKRPPNSGCQAQKEVFFLGKETTMHLAMLLDKRGK